METTKEFWKLGSMTTEEEAKKIAEAVRGWMNEPHEGLRRAIREPLATAEARIKELEAEVARLKEPQSTYERQIASDEKYAKAIQEEWDALRAKVAKYDELRAKFPFLVGDEFYGALSKRTLVLKAGDPVPELKIYRRTVDLFGEKGVIDTNGNSWTWDEMHPTADACRAAIPVEE
jgi:hypothetical protein